MVMVWDGYLVGVIIAFAVGYALIAFEHIVKINKATTAMLAAVVCWTFEFIHKHCVHGTATDCLLENLVDISQIVFFLLGALTIVETISAHRGFDLISGYLHTKSKRAFLWTVGFITFFLSAILDNLTTTIVMASLVSKIIEERSDRWIIGIGIIVAANAGGAWTPIGDLTTTMLWIGGQLTSLSMLRSLFVPSIVCLIVSFLFLHFMLKGNIPKKETAQTHKWEPMGEVVLILGLFLLVLVPILKAVIGLPPFMGMLFGLSILWIVTDFLHKEELDREHLLVTSALARIDITTTLFFLGILLAVSALSSAQILSQLAIWLETHIGHVYIIATLIGLISAVIDNVPLVAGAMGMYNLSHFPTDSTFWNLVAYCAGTGGSILIIGSAAGVVFMGIEKVDFIWYLKRGSIPALAGYFAGIGAYLLQAHAF